MDQDNVHNPKEVAMKEEGLLYDVQSGGFLHIYHDNGKLMIDRQPCKHTSTTAILWVNVEIQWITNHNYFKFNPAAETLH
jgi:hypothetical protein